MTGEPVFDAQAWLTGLGLPQYAEAFKQNDIDAEVLRTLTADDLRELGVSSVGHRRRLLDAAAQWHVRLARPLPRVQRRQITVLFCDLVGSTALASRIDPEDLRDHLNAYRSLLVQLVQEHKGWIAQYLGDGVLAYFGYPQAHEHDAEHAVRAGLAIVKQVAALPVIDGQVPQVRIGIATGLTVIGAGLEADQSAEHSAVGETPNLAARAQAVAEPNSIVIASATRQLIGGLFDCRELGAFALKGFADPIVLWQVTGESGQGSRFDALRAASRHAFVGRESEAAQIVARLTAARAGAGHVVVVSGDAGLGKSRLIDHVLDAAGVPASERLVFQCSPFNTATPLHPVRRYIECASGIMATDPPAAALDKLRALLARAGPVSAERLALVAEMLQIQCDPASTLNDLGSLELRRRTLRTLASVFDASEGRLPVIVIEDLQWLDPSSAELFGTLFSRLPQLPALIVATTRPGPLPDWVAGAHHDVLVLERLNADQTLRLVRAVAAPRALPPAVEDTIVGRSDGVPIFAEELTRGVLGAEASGESAPIPSTLVESLLAQLDRFEHGREIAPVAAVLGREFPINLLQAVSSLAPGAVQKGIDELLEAGVLVPSHSRFGEAVAFRHMLVREAAYQMLVRRDRRRLHAHVALTIETHHAAIAQALPHRMAFHHGEAGDIERAIPYWERAGADAEKRSAYTEAVAHIRCALDLTLKLPAERVRDEREFALRMQLIGPLIAALGFRATEVEREIECATALSQRLGRHTGLVPALALQLMWLGTAGNLEASFGVAMRLRQIAQDGSEVDRLIARRFLSTTLIFRGQFAEAMAEAEAFLSVYDAQRHGHDLARVGPSNHHVMMMVGLAEIYTFFGQPEQARTWRDRSLATAREDGTVHTLSQALVFSGCFLSALTGDASALAIYAAELHQLTHLHGLSAWTSHAELFQGISSLQQGRTEEGLAQARRGVDMMQATHAYSNIWYIVYAQYCEQYGRPEEAWSALELAAPTIATGTVWLEAEYLRLRGRLRLARGEPAAAARADFEAALAVAQGQQARLFVDRATLDLATLAAIDADAAPHT